MQAKSTGELSIITFAANFLGGLARIFTSLQEGGGASMARAYIIGTEHSHLLCHAYCRWLGMLACAGSHTQEAEVGTVCASQHRSSTPPSCCRSATMPGSRPGKRLSRRAASSGGGKSATSPHR